MSDKEDISDGMDFEKPQEKATSKGNKQEKSDKHHPPIIIKKIKKSHGGHHGGAWKIAFADFVTAMMAFFLLMWLIASLNKAQKAGLSEYFKQPIKMSLTSGQSMGNRQVDIKGGGKDISAQDGQVSANNKPLQQKNQSASDQIVAGQSEEMKQLQQLKTNIMLAMNKDPSLAGMQNQLLMDIVHNGLRIQLIDNQKQPMFEVGSDTMDPKMLELLQKIAKLLNTMPNKITIQGHTDAHPYHNPEELDFTNWELSAERANAARRALISAGLLPERVLRVSGYADTMLLNKADPYDPMNRRISIIVMKKNMENSIIKNN